MVDLLNEASFGNLQHVSEEMLQIAIQLSEGAHVATPFERKLKP